MFSNISPPPPENRTVYEINVEKNVVQPDRSQMTI